MHFPLEQHRHGADGATRAPAAGCGEGVLARAEGGRQLSLGRGLDQRVGRGVDLGLSADVQNFGALTGAHPHFHDDFDLKPSERDHVVGLQVCPPVLSVSMTAPCTPLRTKNWDKKPKQVMS